VCHLGSHCETGHHVLSQARGAHAGGCVGINVLRGRNGRTRRCSRRITLAFRPYEAMVSARATMLRRAGKRARG
jgi:hypothetical protein